MAVEGRAEIDAAITRLLERIAVEIEADAKAGCPVKTGRLRESIEHEVQGAGAATVARIVWVLPVPGGPWTRARSGTVIILWKAAS